MDLDCTLTACLKETYYIHAILLCVCVCVCLVCVFVQCTNIGTLWPVGHQGDSTDWPIMYNVFTITYTEVDAHACSHLIYLLHVHQPPLDNKTKFSLSACLKVHIFHVRI